MLKWLVVMAALCSGVFAESLDLSIGGLGTSGTIGYNGTFSIHLIISNIEHNPGPPSEACTNCQFDALSLAATYSAASGTPTWTVAPGGSFSVSGTVPNPNGGTLNGTLLSGSLSGFSFKLFAGHFLLFDSSILSVPADPAGIFGAFNLPNPFPYTGSLALQPLDVTFDSNGNFQVPTNDTFNLALDPTPEPLSLLLFAGGLAGLIALRSAMSYAKSRNDI